MQLSLPLWYICLLSVGKATACRVAEPQLMSAVMLETFYCKSSSYATVDGLLPVSKVTSSVDNGGLLV
jgi:hypothetical protein